MNVFVAMILISILYTGVINVLVATMPPGMIDYVTGFQDLSQSLGSADISEDVISGLDSQTSLPSVEGGALIFYSGNLLLDLMMNFAFAIPSMVVLVFQALGLITGMNPVIINIIQAFAASAIIAYYAINLIQLITGLRSNSGSIA